MAGYEPGTPVREGLLTAHGLEEVSGGEHLGIWALQGYLTHKKHPPSLGPPWGPRHEPAVGS